jgi:hypothetical protein
MTKNKGKCMDSSNKQNKYDCNKCDKSFIGHSVLDNHKINEHNEIIYLNDETLNLRPNNEILNLRPYSGTLSDTTSDTSTLNLKPYSGTLSETSSLVSSVVEKMVSDAINVISVENVNDGK